MSRRNEIYISGDTWRSLWLLSEAGEVVTDEFGASQKKSLDQIADQMLRQSIKEQYPALLQYQKELDKLQKEAIETLRNHETETTVSGVISKGNKN